MFVATYQSDVWVLLGDPRRRAIIERLTLGPCTVAELAGDMPISRPAVSQHLKMLREAGIVHDAPSGRNRIYSIDAARLDRYRGQLDQFWSETLANLTTSSSQRNDQEEIG